MWWCFALLAVAFAHGRALLPSGDSPYGLAAPPRAATWSIGPPMGVVPAGNRRCGWVPHCRRLPLQGALATADCPLAGGQVMAGHPCRGPGSGQPPLQRA
ncbi:hypothetical protein B296_00043303 [Ensete ventricosum]|uniref:Uncharacterized protein n=1 Tax=Ensete ventricosum TaxID=4639 RepID=A0A426Y701_ENSVE|nr:hypothetical protein B296_00043303 [Ensete ventricosum]